MKPPTEGILEQKPSPNLKKLSRVFDDLGPGPVLDVPCGYGRNALLFRQLGHTVVCMDNDLRALQAITQIEALLTSGQELKRSQTTIHQGGRLQPVCFDLISKGWPFMSMRFSMIVNVHFVHPVLFPEFIDSLDAGGFLYCETFGGHGENYLSLPKAGHWKSMLEPWLEFDLYQEKRVSPLDSGAVSVRFLGRKRMTSSDIEIDNGRPLSHLNSKGYLDTLEG